MADLATALDAALRARYRVTEVRTPISQRRGLVARMNQLEKLHARKGDRPGAAGRRAARSAGIAPDTWTRWKKGQRAPSAASLRKIESAYKDQISRPAMRRSLRKMKVPTAVRVTATIKWTNSSSKQYNATPHRSTTLTGMRGVMIATIRAWFDRGPQAAAEAFERGASDVYSVADDGDRPGIEFEGDQVSIEFPREV